MMAQTLKTLIQASGLAQSEIARRTGVSRQAVSLWVKAAPDTELGVKATHLKALAEALGVTADVLLTPLPVISDKKAAAVEAAKVNWDRLYPDLAAFAIAVARGELPAIARLVQIYGLYASAKMAGEVVWDRFPDYQKLIHPAKRADLERVWHLRQESMSSRT